MWLGEFAILAGPANCFTLRSCAVAPSIRGPMLVPEIEIIVSAGGAEPLRTIVRPGGYVIGSDAAAEINIVAEGVADRHAQLVVYL